MHLQRLLFVVLGIVMTFGGVKAQPAGVDGRVYDERSVPLEGVYVGLLALPDSTYLGSAITGVGGEFRIATDYQGAGVLRSRLFGYEDDEQMVLIPCDTVLEIQMQPSSAQLQELIVEGRAPKLTHGAGKFSFVPGALKDFATNSYDLIKLAPMIVAKGDRLDIFGKGPAIIYINGRDPHIPASGIMAQLKSYPPGAIKKIEIITAPGAVIGGQKGIINVVVEYPYEGVIGRSSLSGSLNNGQFSFSPNVWVGYRHRNLSLSGNVSYRHGNSMSKANFGYDYTTMPLTISNTQKGTSHSNSLMGYFTLQYDLSRRSNIGATAIIGDGESSTQTRTTTIETRGSERKESYYESKSDMPFHTPSLSAVAFYYLGTDDKGSGLEIRGDYSYAPEKSRFMEDFNGMVRNEDRSSKYNGYSGKAEYKQRFSQMSDLTAGYEIFGNTQDQRRNGVDMADNFHYNKLVNTVYAQFNGQLSSKIDISAGMRVEHMHDVGRQESMDLRFSHDYTAWLPSLSMRLELPRSQAISVELEKVLYRPFVFSYNPYKNWNSDNSYASGNPDLKPSQGLSATLYYSFRWGLILDAGYHYTWDDMCSVTLPEGNGIAHTTYVNLGHTHSFSVGFQYNKLVTSFWNVRVTADATYNNQKAMIDDYNMGYVRWEGSARWINSFTIPRGWLASLLFYGSTPSSEEVAKIPWQYGMAVEIQKSFPFGLEASIDVSVPFGGERGARYYETSEYRYSKHVLDQKYSIGLSLSYTFGKRTVRAAATRDINRKN